MRIEPYISEHYPRLEAAVRESGLAQSLLHRDFVEWYYNSREWCRLFLVFIDDETVGGVIGLEQLTMDIGGEQLQVGGGSNLASFHPRAGAFLFLHWMRSCDLGLVFGGSDDMHRILEGQRGRWVYFDGVRTFTLNARFAPREGRTGWRHVAATALRAVGPYTHPAQVFDRLVAAGTIPRVAVEEVSTFTTDMLPAGPSPFTLRLAPSLEYLQWRYDPTLPFLRYRVFRLGDGGGYVVLNDRPTELLVAQADAADPQQLAAGILASIAAVSAEADPRRKVVLTTAHQDMQAVFASAGFTPAPTGRRFALGQGKRRVAVDPDTAQWLVNYDWIDNGLRF